MQYHEHRFKSPFEKTRRTLIAIFVIFLIYSVFIYYTNVHGDSAQVMPQIMVKIFIGLAFLLLCYAMLIGVSLKEPTLSLFEGVIRHRYFIIFGVFIFLIVFKLHGFSLGMWDAFIPGGSYQSNVTHLWGKERAITSDVWGLTIPMFFNQVDAGFPFYNTTIMTNGANAILYGLPVWDITGIGRPSLWGFLILGKEEGLAWFYWFRMLGLLMTSFELGMFFTKGHMKLSLMGALVIVLSPLTQWWSGHILPELLLYAQMLLCGVLYYLLNWGNLKKKVLATVVLLVSSVSFVILFSPSLQVPLGYMVLIIGAGMIYEYRENIKFRRQDAFLILSTLAIVVTIIGRFVIISWGDIQLLTGTVSPGARFEIGGGYNLNMAFYHLFQWALPFREVTWKNSCELSTMIPFIPIVVLTLPILWKLDKKRKVLNLALYTYLLFCISWLLFCYPALVAKITLFSNVTPSRLMWTIGVIGVYFGLICFQLILQYKPFSRKIAVIMATAISFIFYLIIQRSNSDYLGPYFLPGVFVTLTAYFLFHISYLLGYKRIMAGILAIALLISGATVMPLNRGTGSMFDKPMSREIAAINAADPDALWLYNSSYYMGNYLSAHGLKVFNVTNMYPDYVKWEKIDPTKKWHDIYNRYAQVSVTLTNTATSLELITRDHVKATLTLGNLHALNIKYIVSPENLEHLNDGSLTEIMYDDVSHVWIYKLDKAL